MNEQEKLRVLIPHWIEHNKEHAASFEGWAAKARVLGHEEHAKEFRRWAETAGGAVPEILAAADAMADANESLAAALEKLGGALDRPHHHNHSH